MGGRTVHVGSDDSYVAVAKLHDLSGKADDKVHFVGPSLVSAGREKYYEAFELLVFE